MGGKGSMAHSSLAIANEFLKRAQDEGKALTHLHVQKLVYIAHGFNLALYGEPLIDEQFQAWEFGPIAPDLYRALRHYGSGPVTRLIRRGEASYWIEGDTGWSDTGGLSATASSTGFQPVTEVLVGPERSVVDRIWHDFHEYEGFQLSALTHGQRSPWKHFYKRGKTEPIPNNSIKLYFEQFVVEITDAAEG
jgi:uncharacterized phage-associated protein